MQASRIPVQRLVPPDTTRLNFNAIDPGSRPYPDRFRLQAHTEEETTAPTDQENAKAGNEALPKVSTAAVEKPAVKAYPNPAKIDGQVHVQLTMPAGTYSFRLNQVYQIVYEASRSIAAVKQGCGIASWVGPWQQEFTSWPSPTRQTNVHTQQLIISNQKTVDR